MLPSFWIFWLLILGACLVLAMCEVRQGNMDQGRERTWTPRYAFAVEYSARIFVLGIFCGWAKAVLWVAA